MLKNWIADRNFKECKKCGNKMFYSKMSNGLYCSSCRKFIAWIPNIYESESKIIDENLRLFQYDSKIRETLGLC